MLLTFSSHIKNTHFSPNRRATFFSLLLSASGFLFSSNPFEKSKKKSQEVVTFERFIFFFSPVDLCWQEDSSLSNENHLLNQSKSLCVDDDSYSYIRQNKIHLNYSGENVSMNSVFRFNWISGWKYHFHV